MVVSECFQDFTGHFLKHEQFVQNYGAEKNQSTLNKSKKCQVLINIFPQLKQDWLIVFNFTDFATSLVK